MAARLDADVESVCAEQVVALVAWHMTFPALEPQPRAAAARPAGVPRVEPGRERRPPHRLPGHRDAEGEAVHGDHTGHSKARLVDLAVVDDASDPDDVAPE